MKKRVLIVDDSDELRKSERFFFEEAGFEVFEANNLKDALHTCAHEQPHLIVLDIYLINELGLDISAEIAKDPAYYGKPKIIVVSGTVGGEMLKSDKFLKQYCVDRFIKKPFDFNDLVSNAIKLLQDP